MTYIIYLFITCSLVLIDQFSKQLVTGYIDLYQKIEVIPGFFNLTYVQNYGAGFSILEGQRTLFLIITVAAVILFSYMLIKGKNNGLLYKASLLLILGGTVGNFIDRLVHTYVVDFLDFIILGYDFPVFNIADSFLTVGVALLLIYTIFIEGKDGKTRD